MKKLVALILIMVMFTLTACGSKEADTSEVSGISAEEEAEKAAEEEAKAAAEEKEEETKEADVDSDAVVAGIVAELPELPSTEYTYEEDWSDRLNRVTHYLINLDGKIKYDDVMEFIMLLESEYGYMSEGKEEWNEADGTTTYAFTNSDGKRIDIIITEPEGDDWMVDMSIRIYV